MRDARNMFAANNSSLRASLKDHLRKSKLPCDTKEEWMRPWIATPPRRFVDSGRRFSPR